MLLTFVSVNGRAARVPTVKTSFKDVPFGAIFVNTDVQ